MINNFIVFLGIVTSALAQMMLKKSGQFEFLKEINFFKFFIFGGFFYVISFVLYSYILKIFALSKISPIMTIGTMALVVLAGFLFFKENINTKQLLGIFLGVISIFLMVK